jgi:hypothetical protein
MWFELGLVSETVIRVGNCVTETVFSVGNCVTNLLTVSFTATTLYLFS